MPASGRSRPVTIESVVVLPAPFGPTTPKIEPWRISRSTSSTARVCRSASRAPRRGGPRAASVRRPRGASRWPGARASSTECRPTRRWSGPRSRLRVRRLRARRLRARRLRLVGSVLVEPAFAGSVLVDSGSTGAASRCPEPFGAPAGRFTRPLAPRDPFDDCFPVLAAAATAAAAPVPRSSAVPTSSRVSAAAPRVSATPASIVVVSSVMSSPAGASRASPSPMSLSASVSQAASDVAYTSSSSAPAAIAPPYQRCGTRRGP